MEFFRLLRAIADQRLQEYARVAGPENLFHRGPRVTSEILIQVRFGNNEYDLELTPAAGGTLMIRQERGLYSGGYGLGTPTIFGSAVLESTLKARRAEKARYGTGRGVPSYIYEAISSWTVYHVHDSSSLAPMRGWCSTSNDRVLSHDASNLAAILATLQLNDRPTYQRILDTCRLAAPFLDDFVFRKEIRGNEEKVRLDWLQVGSQEPFQPGTLSDGTIRFIALVTALLQPLPPSTIVIDEPELGLHPYAISLLADTIRAASIRTQVVVATQSPILLDRFEPSETVVVSRSNGTSRFDRLDSKDLTDWLKDYSLGELWLKNMVGGRPRRD